VMNIGEGHNRKLYHNRSLIVSFSFLRNNARLMSHVAARREFMFRTAKQTTHVNMLDASAVRTHPLGH